MDIHNRLDSLDLHVNPYDFLGLKRGCKDLKEIKKAYHRKSLLLHPDKRKGNDYDFATLNKCYIYLKTLCQELYQQGYTGTNGNNGVPNDTYKTDLEKRMRDIQQARTETEQQYERERKMNSVPSGGSSQINARRVNFEQQLRYDNSIIGADEFDADAVLKEMMTHRPTSTSYINLDTPAIENPFQNRKFNLDQFNQHFMEKMAVGSMVQDVNIDGFSGFDDTCGAASIVSDGRYMFVQSREIPSSYGFLEHFSDYDREFEQERFSKRDLDGKVSDADLKEFAALLDTTACKTSSALQQRKLSKNEFAERMNMLEAMQMEEMEKQRRANKDIIEAQIARLTDATQANLRQNLMITGAGGSSTSGVSSGASTPGTPSSARNTLKQELTPKQAAKFSFPSSKSKSRV